MQKKLLFVVVAKVSRSYVEKKQNAMLWGKKEFFREIWQEAILTLILVYCQ